MKRVLNLLAVLPLATACDGGDSETTGDGSTTTTADSGASATATSDSSGSTDSTDTGATTGTDGTTGDTGGSGHAGSCDFQPTEPQCWHAVNKFDEPATIMQACTDGGGVYSAGDCTTANLVAICDQTPFKIFHYYDGVDLALTEVVCMQIGGVWMPQ